MSTQQRQGRSITAIARNPNGSTVTASITVKPTFNNIVLAGQKIISKEMDDLYV